jgi:hypothetical protein
LQTPFVQVAGACSHDLKSQIGRIKRNGSGSQYFPKGMKGPCRRDKCVMPAKAGVQIY